MDGSRREIIVWVDTAFNGALVLPRTQITDLDLVQESSAEAVLADGKLVELETFACFFDWFGHSYKTQIIANDRAYRWLGTMLLVGRRVGDRLRREDCGNNLTG
jgi:predicted aspartyl protease